MWDKLFPFKVLFFSLQYNLRSVKHSNFCVQPDGGFAHLNTTRAEIMRVPGTAGALPLPSPHRRPPPGNERLLWTLGVHFACLEILRNGIMWSVVSCVWLFTRQRGLLCIQHLTFLYYLIFHYLNKYALF